MEVNFHFNKSLFMCGACSCVFVLKSNISITVICTTVFTFYLKIFIFFVYSTEAFYLLQTEKYHYLNQSGCITDETISDKETFQEVKVRLFLLLWAHDEYNLLFLPLSAGRLNCSFTLGRLWWDLCQSLSQYIRKNKPGFVSK